MNDIATIGLPAKLPADGQGFSKRLVMHLNFGSKGGAATYTIHDASGAQLPIGYQYDTRKKGAMPTGFFLDDDETQLKSWSEVVAYWPTWLEARKA